VFGTAARLTTSWRQRLEMWCLTREAEVNAGALLL